MKKIMICLMVGIGAMNMFASDSLLENKMIPGALRNEAMICIVYPEVRKTSDGEINPIALAALLEWQDNDPMVRFISYRNLGLSTKENFGIAKLSVGWGDSRFGLPDSYESDDECESDESSTSDRSAEDATKKVEMHRRAVMRRLARFGMGTSFTTDDVREMYRVYNCSNEPDAGASAAAAGTSKKSKGKDKKKR